MWVKRWLTLNGRMLAYSESRKSPAPRGALEIDQYTKVHIEEKFDGKGGVLVIEPRQPSARQQSVDLSNVDLRGSSRRASWVQSLEQSGDLWYLYSSDRAVVERWLATLTRCIDLIRRVEAPPTLEGMGSVRDHYDLGRVACICRFGVMRIALRRRSNEARSVKVIHKKRQLGTKLARQIMRNELRILRILSRIDSVRDHPGLLKLHETYEDTDLIYMVVDGLSGDDLFDQIVQRKNYTEKACMMIAKDILEALAALHHVGIVLRDFKPENILFSLEEGRVKIADFGLAGTVRQFRREELEAGRPLLVGTPGYMSPEVISTKRNYATPCDMYAFGVCLFTILVGYPPICGSTKADIYAETVKGNWTFVSNDWLDISVTARNLVMQCMLVDHSKRISADEALRSEWVQNLSQRPDSGFKMLQSTLNRLCTFNRARKLKAAASVAASNHLPGSGQRALSRLMRSQAAIMESPSCPDFGSLLSTENVWTDGSFTEEKKSIGGKRLLGDCGVGRPQWKTYCSSCRRRQTQCWARIWRKSNGNCSSIRNRDEQLIVQGSGPCPACYEPAQHAKR